MEKDGNAENKHDIEEPSFTMLDELKQEKELEQEYAVVLGGSDDEHCTFAQGAIKRQALYSCLTCCPEARNDLSKSAGVCLACSYHCHDNHELVELYTKRNFCCDCPTERMGGANMCRLNDGIKQPVAANRDNLYNQNFQGLYCNCHRPYPDPERTAEEEMFQCTICEDWYHLHHLNGPSNAQKLKEVCVEMICEGCMGKHEFLHSYIGISLNATENAEESSASANVIVLDASVCEDNGSELKSNQDKSISEIINIGETEEATGTDNEAPPAKRTKIEEKMEAKCFRPSNDTVYEKGAIFWAADWKSFLCRCTACMTIYKNEKVEYLLDPEDSVKSYSERGIKKVGMESTYEKGLRALASIDRVHQINFITGYNHMKDKLKEYLQTFADSNKVVTEDDINRFFRDLNNEKNIEVDIPHSCR